jgi:hypothetical protein
MQVVSTTKRPEQIKNTREKSSTAFVNISSAKIAHLNCKKLK